MATKKSQVAAGATEELQADDFNSLLEKEFRPKSAVARNAVETAVQTLAEQVLAETTLISDAVSYTHLTLPTIYSV